MKIGIHCLNLLKLPACHDLQFNDVWVTEKLEILNFSLDFTDDIKTLDLLPVENLYSHLMIGQVMGGN